MANAELAVTILGAQTGFQNLVTQSDPVSQINNIGQLAAGLASLVGNPQAILASNTAAAMVTLGKMDLDVRNGKYPAIDDVMSIAGNLVSMAAVAAVTLTPTGRAAGILMKAAIAIGGTQVFGYVISNSTASTFNAAQNWTPRRDPLTLDLDGDGLETVAPSSTSPILFDHDGDGVKNGTGWVKADDGFLVLDRNGNGTIDNGRELFGDSTPLASGGNAANGFEALAQEDTNDDGKVDANDDNFEQLRIWRDLNQDGISQTGELSTLSSLNIASLNVAKIRNSQILPGGNRIADLGTYTRTDGTVGTAGDVAQLGDIDLADDTFHREFTDHIPLAEGVSALPNMQGSGSVRDLWEAASLSPGLMTLLSQYASAATRTEQVALLDSLIETWGATSPMATSIDVSTIETIYNSWSGNYPQPADYQSSSGITVIQQFKQNNPALFAQINTLEKFNGRNILGAWIWQNGYSNYGFASYTITVAPQRQDLFGQGWGSLKSSVYQSILLQTRFKSILDAVDLKIENGSFELDFTAVRAEFQRRMAENPALGIADLIDFNRATNNLLKDTAWGDISRGALAENLSKIDVTTELAVLSQWFGEDVDAILLAQSQNGNLSGAIGNDIIVGNSGGNSLYGNAGSDILDGGVGDDQLDGGSGNDIYLFRRGSGQDTVYQSYYLPNKFDVVQLGVLKEDVRFTRLQDDLVIAIVGTTDTLTVQHYFSISVASLEQLKFADGTAWGLAEVKQRTVTVGTSGEDYIQGYDGGPNRTFALEGDDRVTGGDRDDELHGGNGNDTIYGGAGNDILNGDGGDDVVYGGNDADIMDGGAGNDSLTGGDGNDIYRFDLGSGHDVIDNLHHFNESQNQTDTVEFGVGLKPEDVSLTLFGGNLVIAFTNTSDTLTIKRGFGVEQLKFADGTVWDVTVMKQKTITVGTAGPDTLQGYTGSPNRIYGFDGADRIYGSEDGDLIDGGNGNDELRGNRGSDRIIGGVGDDYLEGGDGEDVYLFGRSSGHDVIMNINWNEDMSVPTTDTIQLDSDVAPDEVTLTRIGDDLVLTIAGELDSLTVHNHFLENRYRINHISFTDGTMWDATTIQAEVDEYRTFRGTEGEDVILGDALDNLVYGLAGNDVLNGGEGHDIVEGGAGDDTLIGGTGFDRLIGGLGDDTYIIDNEYASAIEFAGEGHDRVLTNQHYELPDNVEDLVLTGDGSLTGQGNSGNNSLIGNAANNTLSGHDGDDRLDGGDGDDALNGGNGNDRLNGNAGIDLLSGGDGADIYVLERGNGIDRIIDTTEDPINRIDTIEFGAGIAPSDIQLSRIDNSLRLLIAGTDDGILIEGWYEPQAFSTVGLLKFEDGTTWDVASLANLQLPFTGTHGSEYVGGSQDADIIFGLGGDDTVYGNGGDDVISGGKGNDYLDGGYGRDTFVFERGDGVDRIEELSFDDRTDKIRFGADIAPADIVVTRQDNNLVLTIAGTEDRISVSSYFRSSGDGVSSVSTIEFADGTVWDITAVRSMLPPVLPIIGTDDADYLHGTDQAELIDGLAGDDVIDGDDGNDRLNGGDGNDLLRGGNGNDTVFGGDGNDELYDDSGADHLVGGNGNDILDGYVDNDLLEGGTGNDTYQFSWGYGQDTIVESDTTAGNQDTLRLYGVTPDDLTVTRDSNNLYIEINGTDGADKLTIQDFFVSGGEIEHVQFDDDSIWDRATLLSHIPEVVTNHAPTVANAITAQSSAEKQPWVFAIPADTFSDIDTGDQLTYGATLDNGDPLPTWLSFDSATQSFTGNPGNADVGAITLKLTATDQGGLSATSSFTLDITNVNDAPVVSMAIANQATLEDAPFSFVVPTDTFTDMDAGDVLTLSATLADGTALPTWLSFNAASRTFSGTPSNGNVGNLSIKLMATDQAGASASTHLNLSITNVNDAPTVSVLLADQAVIEYKALSYVVPANTFADIDVGDTRVINASLEDGSALPDWLSFDPDTLTFSGTPSTLDLGVIKVKVTATDQGGLSVSDVFDLSVNAAPGQKINGTAGNDTLTGASGNDTLNGGVGADTMSGGTGNDKYLVDNVGDVVIEKLNEGTDTVQSSISYTLGAYVENLQLTGTAAINGTGNELNNTVTGNSTANTLTGGAGDDSLNGAAGADTLIGGVGNDNYTVDNAGDSVVENANEGTDRVKSYITYTLGNNIENLTLLGTTAIDGTGNALANSLTGNGAANRLAGGDGSDILSGGAGNDTLLGEAGDDTLTGGTGADTLVGGGGNDVYVIADDQDTVTELANEGIDRVNAGISYTLGDNVENLTLTGTAEIAGVGNALDNVLSGNNAKNYLNGLAGNDTVRGNGANDILQGGIGNDIVSDNGGQNLLDGGAGTDTLTGNAGNELFIGGQGNDTITTGTGADLIVFNKGDGQDTVRASSGADNTLSLGGGINYTDLTLSKTGTDLIVGTGGTDSIKFAGWYSTAANNKSVLNLQMIAEAMADFNATGTDPLRDNNVETFNFARIVDKFDQARGTAATFSNWAVTNALLEYHLTGSDSAALGGDLAYQYGKNGNLQNVSINPAQAVLGSAQFGTTAQSLQPVANLQDSSPRLG